MKKGECRLIAVDRFRALVGLSALWPALLLLGCGQPVIDDDRLEDELSRAVGRAIGVGVSTTSCPSEISILNAGKFKCLIRFDSGGSSVAQARIQPASDNREARVQLLGIEARR
jgi:hypothetical protein